MAFFSCRTFRLAEAAGKMSVPDKTSSCSVGPLSPVVRLYEEELEEDTGPGHGGGGGTRHYQTCSPPQSLALSAGKESLPLLLITANVGSMFDDPHHLIPQWLAQVCQQIRAQKPAFVAIHCQEVRLHALPGAAECQQSKWLFRM